MCPSAACPAGWRYLLSASGSGQGATAHGAPLPNHQVPLPPEWWDRPLPTPAHAVLAMPCVLWSLPCATLLFPFMLDFVTWDIKALLLCTAPYPPILTQLSDATVRRQLSWISTTAAQPSSKGPACCLRSGLFFGRYLYREYTSNTQYLLPPKREDSLGILRAWESRERSSIWSQGCTWLLPIIRHLASPCSVLLFSNGNHACHPPAPLPAACGNGGSENWHNGCYSGCSWLLSIWHEYHVFCQHPWNRSRLPCWLTSKAEGSQPLHRSQHLHRGTCCLELRSQCRLWN